MKINVIAPINTTGYGYHARGLIEGLVQEGAEVKTLSLGKPMVPNEEVTDELMKSMVRSESDLWPDAPNVRIYHHQSMVDWPNNNGPRVGFTVFELNKIPKDSVADLNKLDLVLTCSEWGREVLKQNGVTTKTGVVPHGVDQKVFYPVRPWRNSGVCFENPFRFLYIGKWERRKSTEEILSAFLEEFEGEDDVCLYMIADNMWMDAQKMQELKDQYFTPGKVVYLPRLPSNRDIANEIFNCDCFVSASKAEGWGLSILEAMACNRPVITTNVTGLTEYVTEQNSLTIRTTGLQPAGGMFFEAQDGEWHTIDEADLRSQMRAIYSVVKHVGPVDNVAGADTGRKYSWNYSAKTMINILEDLNG